MDTGSPVTIMSIDCLLAKNWKTDQTKDEWREEVDSWHPLYRPTTMVVVK